MSGVRKTKLQIRPSLWNPNLNPLGRRRMPRFRPPLSIRDPTPSGGTRPNRASDSESRTCVRTTGLRESSRGEQEVPRLSACRRRRRLLAQAFGLADQFLAVGGAPTFGANVSRVADKLLICLEIRLQQLLQITKRSSH
jgi:hypothetical protein